MTDAGESIRKAAATWNPADPDAVASSQRWLERAVGDLRLATRFLRRNPVENPAELRPLVAAMKREVNRMSREADAGLGLRPASAACLERPRVV